MILVTLMWSTAGIVTRHLEAARSFEVTFWRSAFTMLALAIPMCVLFEISVLVAWRHDKRKAAREAREYFHDLSDDEASPLDTSPTPLDAPDSIDETRR